MPRMMKHLVLFGLALPASYVGYHLFVEGMGRDGGAEASTGADDAGISDLAVGVNYDLANLQLFEKSLFYVEQRYVEKERLNPELMFQSALDRVERQIPEVMFVREPMGKRLQVSVGAFTTVLLVEPIDNFAELNAELRKVAAVLKEHLSTEIKREDIEYAFVNGALSTLDPHSVLLPPVAAHEMDVDNQGEFGGLGIEITVANGRLTVKQPLADTPAAKAGLKSEDQIVRIEDESTINMDLNDAVSKLRGPIGSTVNIWVKRKTFPSPQKFAIKRDRIKVNAVEGVLLEGGIGYVKIKAFNDNVSTDLEGFLTRFRAENKGELKGLVLDLRDDPGGYLNQAVEVSDRFLTDGVIVTTVEGASKHREEQRATKPGTEPAYPIAVLVNGNSASASEIVAGALRNQERAIIIGERTFGKGSVQHLYQNNDESKLKLTVAKYLTPGDNSIQSVGIPPDIALLQSVIKPVEKATKKAGVASNDADPNPLISLYWRDWISREGDLDHHLENSPVQFAPPAWSVRYLRPIRDEDQKPDPRTDWEVSFAREVLRAAPGSRRADVVAGAATVVASHQKAEAARLTAAFKQVGIDWTAGVNPAAPTLEVHLDLGPDGVIRAGQTEDVALVVRNTGTEPIYQLSATSESDNAWFEHREFYFGRLNPGETRRSPLRVVLHDGYGAEVAPVKLTFRDPDHTDIFKATELLRTEAAELPRFEYTVTLHDDGSGSSKGNKNGIPEVGETIDLEIAITNAGKGASGEGFARVKNRSGRALDLSNGGIQLGDPKDKDGKACEPDSDGCERHLAAGQTYKGRVSFELRAPPEDGKWKLDLQVGDNARYDYASIQRGGFYDYFQLNETLEMSPGQPLEGRVRTAPAIQVSRRPETSVGAPGVVISGAITDDAGIRDVMVFHGEEKIFYRGGEVGLTTLPFTVEPTLAPGTNLIYLLARDFQGLTASYAIQSWYEAPGTIADVTPPGKVKDVQ
jgi:carboxyl-terminal processing protease